ncbi:MAG: aminoacyl-tRNA hydrolase [Angelakisella sp.]|jgi:PTH1 family peptidyl-tRNA hydrolase|nr:aminoacyl-tRNA hydrolase [Angelakisella sp.]
MSTLDELFAKIAAGRKAAPAGPVEYLIVGLGNPGAKYNGTRHNTGFMALDALAEKLGARVERLQFKALTGDAVIGEKRVLLMKPGTFMNLSGQAVQEAAAYHKVPMDRVLVLMDDISLPVGALRIRKKGSAGGHNGLKNIIYLTGRDDFPRVKIGVGEKPHPDYDLADWVLGKFSPEDAKSLLSLFADIPAIAECFVQGRLDEAMSKYNRSGPPKAKGPEPSAGGHQL